MSARVRRIHEPPGEGDLTLLTASRSPDRSHAAVLLRLLGRR
ncbi:MULTISPECIES: hypothetical protein [unclassified Streptomyces]|nr:MULTISPECIES: hypothetical protein [unclassified Streptomyces]